MHSTHSELTHYIALHELQQYLPLSLIASMSLTRLQIGERLFHQGGCHTDVYLLVEGRVEIEHYDEAGGRAVFSFEDAFSVLGELELFLEVPQSLMTNAVCIEPAVILKLPTSAVVQYGLRHAGFLKLMCDALSRKLYASATLHSASSYSARQKVCRYLSHLYHQHGSNLTLHNRESISAMLGLSVRQLSRVLGNLAREGAIEYRAKSVNIKDAKKLTASSH